MAEQIRLVLTVDEAIKKLIEDSATEFCEGNSSAYVRGLVVLHQLLLGKPTGKADYPGWMLEQFPLQKIDRIRGSMEDFQRIADRMKAAANSLTGEVRINELARELEVKAATIVELLPRFGVTTKKTHSSSISVEVANKVRQALRKA
jgi:hypothetical protein